MIKYSPVPVLNALSSLWHPTQTLADLLTLHEHAELFNPEAAPAEEQEEDGKRKRFFKALPELRPLTIAYLGDSTNVLHDMLVTYPRFGHTVQVATPADKQYQCPEPVWDRVKELGCDKGIKWTTDPREAVNNADVIVTDTWYAELSSRIMLYADDV
jgi:ornithine carbamoyltransferase